MPDLNEFIGYSHSLLIAPAGYGKTHTIAECLNLVKGKHLVLTHTNAGIGSILEKVKSLNVPTSNYQILTISSLAQTLAIAYSKDLPVQENNKEYYKAIIIKATELIKTNAIAHMLQNSYSGLFVDEYQDCTISQHFFIQELSTFFPTHLLGDPMQGIFNLDKSDPLVNFEDKVMMGNYLEHTYHLDKPWRWIKHNNLKLGEDLHNIRLALESTQTPLQDFSNYKSISFYQFDKNELYSKPSESEFKRLIYQILNRNENVLFILSNSINRESRLNIVKAFLGRIMMLESMDEKRFYSISRSIDSTVGKSIIANIHDLLIELFPKTEIEKYIKNDHLIKPRNKKGENPNTRKSQTLKNLIEKFECTSNLLILKDIIQLMSEIIGRQPIEKEIYFTIIRAIENAYYNGTTVYDEIKNQRNISRRVGRRLYGKSIGTTLLTKGLECDTAVLLDDSDYPFNYKNQYVALTRGGKNVIVIKLIGKPKVEAKKPRSTNENQLSLWN